MIPFPLFIFYLKHSKVCRELQDKSAGIYFFREKLWQRTVETDGSSGYCCHGTPKRSLSVGAIPLARWLPHLGYLLSPCGTFTPLPLVSQVIKKNLKKKLVASLQPGNENHQKNYQKIIKKIIKKPLPKFPGWFPQNKINRSLLVRGERVYLFNKKKLSRILG